MYYVCMYYMCTMYVCIMYVVCVCSMHVCIVHVCILAYLFNLFGSEGLSYDEHRELHQLHAESHSCVT